MGRQRKLRETALSCGIVLTLAHFASGAAAFTQEPVSPPSATPQGNAAQAGQSNITPQVPQAEMVDPFAQAGKSKGTEVTIPGIGSVGTLPKLDFGLELLYGPKSVPDSLPLDQHTPDSEMQIKGTLTHKF